MIQKGALSMSGNNEGMTENTQSSSYLEKNIIVVQF